MKNKSLTSFEKKAGDSIFKLAVAELLANNDLQIMHNMTLKLAVKGINPDKAKQIVKESYLAGLDKLIS